MHAKWFEPSMSEEWDEFVLRSRNGTFLCLRSYMDYHSHRFNDASIIFFKKNKIAALLPAHRDKKNLYSHLGLTFAGLIVSNETKFTDVEHIFTELISLLHLTGCNRLYYKKVPLIFTCNSNDEDLHILNAAGAKLVRRDLSAIIDLRNDIKISKSRMMMIRKAKSLGLVIKEGSFFKEFYEILSNVMRSHNTTPVHSLDEIKLLCSRFPDRIILKGAFKDNKLVAAALLYQFDRVAHTQYLAASDEGKRMSALDLIIYETLNSCGPDMNYMSFGTSTTNNGLELNAGLMFYKESFGARAMVLDHYELVL